MTRIDRECFLLEGEIGSVIGLLLFVAFGIFMLEEPHVAGCC